MIRAGIYCRVSTDEQAKNGISLQCQQDALTEYATKHEYCIVDYYIDDGFTGTNLKRPGLQRLLEDVKKKKIDIVLITKLDRWGRGVKNYYKVDEILSANKVHWKTILEDYDTQTSAGKLHINIMLSIAENESATTSDRIKFVFKEKLRKKEPVSLGRKPLGYKVFEKKYIVDDEQATIVKDCFKTFLDCQSLRMTRIIINSRYNTTITDRAMKNLLERKLYIGIYEGSGLVINDFCSPIISNETFNETQKILENNVKVYGTDRTKVRDYIFTGMIVCKDCGKKLSGRTGAPIHRDIARKRNAYVCSRYRSNGNCCNNHSISEKKIELELLSHLKEKIYNLNNELISCDENISKVEQPTINKDKIKNQIENLLNLYLDGNITKEIYTKKYSALLTLLEESDKEVEIKNNFDPTIINNILQSPIEERYLQMNAKERRRFWRGIVKEISWSHDSIIDFKLLTDDGILTNNY